MGEPEGEMGIGEELLLLSRECLPNCIPAIEYALIEESKEGVGKRQLTGFVGCGVRVWTEGIATIHCTIVSDLDIGLVNQYDALRKWGNRKDRE
uniref:Uncharacterized protein n=1 Tax=Pristionchus pacificus TaxID=54126 RepID=A0A2A6C120_PRIPA|eukprot:PDM71840.1 hypothetical protein PRIPAC_38247 [Pristionchus pacificus]